MWQVQVHDGLSVHWKGNCTETVLVSWCYEIPWASRLQPLLIWMRKNILHVFALQCEWLAELYKSIKSSFASETWSLHLAEFTDILGRDLALVDCQPIKSSNGNLRATPIVSEHEWRKIIELLARPACFCQKVFWMMNSWRHLFSNAPVSLVFYLILPDCIPFFLICPFSRTVTFNQHRIHDLFGGHFSHELTSPNFLYYNCSKVYFNTTNPAQMTAFHHSPRWFCCSLPTYPSSFVWPLMATFIRLMLLLTIDSADFAKVFLFWSRSWCTVKVRDAMDLSFVSVSWYHVLNYPLNLPMWFTILWNAGVEPPAGISHFAFNWDTLYLALAVMTIPFSGLFESLQGHWETKPFCCACILSSKTLNAETVKGHHCGTLIFWCLSVLPKACVWEDSFRFIVLGAL